MSAAGRRVSLAQLVKHVDVSRVAPNKFLGQSFDLGWGRVYGGQTMAQALSAAMHFVGHSRQVHHLQCNFLRGGDVTSAIEFECDELMQGRSFSAVHVRALQKEKPILTMTASFQTPEAGLEHQEGSLLPEWRRPDELQSLPELLEPHLHKIPKKIQPLYTEAGTPFDIRPSEPTFPWDPTVRPPTRAFWIRAKEPLPDDQRVHEALLTYASDWGFLEAAIFPHPTALWKPELRAASLSHSMHFHQPFRLDRQWVCHAVRSPVSSGGRGYVVGEVWTEDGVLVASTAQEGLMRLIDQKRS